VLTPDRLARIIKFTFVQVLWAAFFAFGAWFVYDAIAEHRGWSIPGFILVAVLIFSQAYAVWMATNWGVKVFMYAFGTRKWRPQIRAFAAMVPVCLRTFRSVFPFVIGTPFFLGIYLLRQRWTGFDVGLACFLLAALAYALFEIWPPYAVVLGTSSGETCSLFFAVHNGLYPLKVIACVDSEDIPVVLLRYTYRTSGRFWKKQVNRLLSVCWVVILDARHGSGAVSQEVAMFAQKRCRPIVVTKDDGTCPALTEAEELRLRSRKAEFVTVAELLSQFSRA